MGVLVVVGGTWDLVKIVSNTFSAEDLRTLSRLITMEPISVWHFYPAAKDSASLARKANGRGQCGGAWAPLGPPEIRYLSPYAQTPLISCQPQKFSACVEGLGLVREMGRKTEEKIHVRGVREILIRRGGGRGGFTEPTFSFRDPVNETKECRRRAGWWSRGAGEIRQIVTGRGDWWRVVESCVFSLVLGWGSQPEGWALHRFALLNSLPSITH